MPTCLVRVRHAVARLFVSFTSADRRLSRAGPAVAESGLFELAFRLGVQVAVDLAALAGRLSFAAVPRPVIWSASDLGVLSD